MRMTIKFDKKVELTQDQLEELANVVSEPDITWEGEMKEFKHEKTKVKDVITEGEHGTYKFRVNYSWQLIKVKEVR